MILYCANASRTNSGRSVRKVHHRGAADKRADKSDHEIDGVIRRKNAQVAHSGPEGIQRGQRLALLKIIFMREHAAFRPSASARGIDDAGCVISLARNEHRVRRCERNSSQR